MSEKKKLTIGNIFTIIVVIAIIFICIYGVIYNSNVIDFKKQAPADTVETVIDSTIVKQ